MNQIILNKCQFLVIAIVCFFIISYLLKERFVLSNKQKHKLKHSKKSKRSKRSKRSKKKKTTTTTTTLNPIKTCQDFQNEVEKNGPDGQIKDFEQCMQECYSHDPLLEDFVEDGKHYIYCGLGCECEPFCQDHYQ